MKYLIIAFTLLSINFASAATIADNDDRYYSARSGQGVSVLPRAALNEARRAYKGVGLNGIVAPLAAKAQEIMSACGSYVASGVRIGSRVRGSGRLSLHHSGQAVDMVGNPSCIYAQLANWPGGYSTDYSAVRHVHISYGGSEHGLRFRHR